MVDLPAPGGPKSSATVPLPSARSGYAFERPSLQVDFTSSSAVGCDQAMLVSWDRR